VIAALLGVLAVGVAACGGTQPEPCTDGSCIPVVSGDITLAAQLDLPPGPGPHPVVTLVHGSGRGTREDFAGVVDTYRAAGFGVVRYDKRGAGASTGRFRDVNTGNSIEVFDLLAADLLAVVNRVATEPNVDVDRIGLLGVSQAGWVMPLAAVRSDAVAFVVSISGAASSVGISDHYDNLAEDTATQEIGAALAAFDGPHGYDPASDLESLEVPALWIYGARDLSNPTANDVAILNRLRDEFDKDFTIEVFEDADHGLNNTTTGQPVDAQSVVNRWLADRVVASD
jgi:hypothetical protein